MRFEHFSQHLPQSERHRREHRDAKEIQHAPNRKRSRERFRVESAENGGEKPEKASFFLRILHANYARVRNRFLSPIV